MPNINAVVNEQIRRLARREITAHTKTIKKATGHYRRDIAALKRQIAQLFQTVGALRKQMPAPSQMPPAEIVQKARLRVSGLKAHRARLGLSAQNYGKLMGVSGLTIYNWEAGKSKPRRSQLSKIVSVRGIGKREAMQRLGMGEEPETVTTIAKQTPNPKTGKRGTFKQTGEEMILGLLKGRKALTAAEINAAWTTQGRKGSAAVLLSKMTTAKKLKRAVVKGQRGGTYRAG
jgi:DNA-binding transcriptional regulator YiaG